MATQKQNERKTRTLARLEQQLSSGKKPARTYNEKTKRHKTSLDEKVPLTDQDKKRLNTEIGNLKKKLHITV